MKSVLDINEILYTIDQDHFIIEDLINKLIDDYGKIFKNLILKKDTFSINPEILIFVDNKEIGTLKKLKTPLHNDNQITFLSSIHGGFNLKTQDFY